MADKKKKPNIFKRIAQKFNDVRLELKRVIWPTKEKLAQNSAVFLVVIAVCAILLTAIGKVAGWVLEKVLLCRRILPRLRPRALRKPRLLKRPHRLRHKTEV